jgi:hypothetical protein
MGASWRTSQMQHCGTTRASDTPFAARPNRMVRFRRLSLWPWPMLFPVRNCARSCCGCIPHGARRILRHQGRATDSLEAGLLLRMTVLFPGAADLPECSFYYREAANVIARIVGQNLSISVATLHRDYVDLCGPIAFIANIVRGESR